MCDLYLDILLLVWSAHLVVCIENRFSALRPEPELKERDNHQPGKIFCILFMFFYAKTMRVRKGVYFLVIIFYIERGVLFLFTYKGVLFYVVPVFISLEGRGSIFWSLFYCSIHSFCVFLYLTVFIYPLL